ncbi:cyclin-D3-2-like [Abrus precatorius]|uniref:B-like cyclin n=1 Tax=Abrus precatorius TaxID=3816 RepID=A0A8B8M0S0_ABRPR|nr:cyclin-D3-2-like [Abrus precatorius]
MPRQHSPSFLLCQEQYPFQQHSPTNHHSSPLTLFHNDSFFQHHHLLSLLAKERPTHFRSHTDATLSPRQDAVRWIFRVSSLYAFTALTTVLAVNYFDRSVTSVRFQSDKPWMAQLVAVACLSLAAKMEETQVPLLLDLQVEESKFVFEPKTIQRMELLVLSTLKWKMNPVTPISFFQHLVTRLGLKSHLHWEFLCRCERVLLSVIADSRVMSYLPSTLAAATMIHVIEEIESFNALECRNQVLGLLNSSEEQVNECYKLMLKKLVCCEGIHNLCQKRKRLSEPSSPGGVIDASFSCESSNDSWAVASSVTLSLEPVFKKSKVQEQQMRLPLVNHVSVDVLSSPR